MALMLGLTQRLHRLHSPSDGPSPCHFHRRFLRISTNLAASGSRHQPEPSPRSQPLTARLCSRNRAWVAAPGEGGHAFEDAPVIGETPCRLKPRDDGTRAPGGRWICGGFLRLAVCYRPGSPLRWTAAARLEVRECGACLAWERDGWTFEANPCATLSRQLCWRCSRARWAAAPAEPTDLEAL